MTGPVTSPRAATRNAATTAVLMTRHQANPSSRIKRKVIANDSSSLTRSAASMTERSNTAGGSLAANAFDFVARIEIRMTRINQVRKPRADWVGENDFYAWDMSFQMPPNAGNRSTGSHPAHECAESSITLRNNLWSGGLFMDAGSQSSPNWSVRNQPRSVASRSASRRKLRGSLGGAFAVTDDFRGRVK